MTRRHEILHAGGFPFLVAEIAGDVVGLRLRRPYRARPDLSLDLEDSIYIAPNMQRRASVARCSTPDRRGGGGRVPADDRRDRDSAEHRSIEPASRRRLRLVARFDNVGFKFGRWLDSVLMQLPLGKGATTTR